jgi:mannose-6-phosphate isomerase-like protein (cupin superfamily)
MAEAGDHLQMPDGSVYIVIRPGAATGGEYVEMEFVLPADCVPPPPHTHPAQVEEYEVIEGRFDVVVDGRWVSLGPGESASVPIGALHTFRNSSGSTVRVRNWHRPALRFEEFIERTCASLQAAGLEGQRDPRIFMILSRTMLAYPDTLEVPRLRERLPLKLLAGAGRLLRLPDRAS